MIAHVYILELLPSGVFYIGSSQNVHKRFNRHILELTNGKHHNVILQEAWKSTTDVNLNTVEFTDRESAYKYEEKAIQNARASKRSNLLANIGNNAIGGNNLTYHPDSKRLSQQRGDDLKNWMSKLSPEERKAIYSKPGDKNPMFGKTHTAEVRKRLSERNMGHSYNKGIKLSPEHIEKIKIRQRLRVGDKNSFYNKRHSEKTKALLRQINIGRVSTTRKAVMADGIRFASQTEAAKHFGIGVALVAFRVKSKSFPEWHLVETDPN